MLLLSLAQGKPVAYTEATTKVTQPTRVISSTGVPPPDRVRAISAASSLPAGYALPVGGLWSRASCGRWSRGEVWLVGAVVVGDHPIGLARKVWLVGLGAVLLVEGLAGEDPVGIEGGRRWRFVRLSERMGSPSLASVRGGRYPSPPPSGGQGT